MHREFLMLTVTSIQLLRTIGLEQSGFDETEGLAVSFLSFGFSLLYRSRRFSFFSGGFDRDYLNQGSGLSSLV